MSCKADQVAELVHDMQVNVAKYGRENPTTYLMVRARAQAKEGGA